LRIARWHLENKMKFLKYVGIFLAVVVVSGSVAWWYFSRQIPHDVMLDVKAAMAARNTRNPLHSYLEARYGSLTNPANREKAFLGFFDVDHIKGMHFLASHMPPERRLANAKAMAKWIADYRETMTDTEKQDLREILSSPEGVASIRKATSQYLKQDVRYRAANADAITELMTTLSTIQALPQ